MMLMMFKEFQRRNSLRWWMWWYC